MLYNNHILFITILISANAILQLIYVYAYNQYTIVYYRLYIVYSL